MKKLKLHDFNDVMKKSLKNKKVQEEYDKLEEVYTSAEEFIELRIKNKMT